MNDTPLKFLPRDLTFWLYHWVCLSLLVFSHVVLAAFFQEEFFVFNLLGFILWLPLFTLAVLCFRFLYKTKSWENFNMGTLISLSLGFAFVAGFIVTSLILLSMLPLFLSNLYVVDSFYNTSVPYSEFAFKLLSLNTIQSQVFMTAWIFIYVSVTSNRKIKQAEYQNLRLENNLKEAKISSLSNQLKPHLLFNTLNNIRFMIYENPEKADDMITALSDILRYSLTEGLKDKVTLREEMDIIRRYFDIMTMQFDDRIEFNIEIDEKLMQCLIPPMSLQMLSENAIKHGLEGCKQGVLTLKAYEEGDKIAFDIANPLPKQKREVAAGAGIGLKNIKQRLNILYNEQAELRTHQDGDRFLVHLSLPKEVSK